MKFKGNRISLIIALLVFSAGACSDDAGSSQKNLDASGSDAQADVGDAGDIDSAPDADTDDDVAAPVGCAAQATPTADDSDGDGLSDAQETAGWTVRVDENGQGTIVPRKVYSLVDDADSDDDGLCDAEESSLKTDPTATDTDQDGLDDFAEVRQWSSSPTNVDTDGDGMGNPLFYDGAEINTHGTSPTLEDTDGDGRSDFVEINQNSTNALLADLPKPAVNLVGTMDLGVNVKLSSGDVTEDAVTTSLEASDSTTTSETSTVATGSSVENSKSVTAEASVSYPWGASLSVSGTLSQTEGYFENDTSTWTEESTQSASEGYEELVGKTRSEGSTTDDGTIAMQMNISNQGTRSFEISDVVLTALLRDPSDPGKFTSIDTLTLPDEANGLVIGEGEERGPFRIEADIPANVALSLLSNPSGIFFQVASFKLNDRDGEDFNFSIGETTSNRTALVVLDYGGERPLERYRVATNVERNADATLAGIPLENVFNDVLKLQKGTDYTVAANPDGVSRLTAIHDIAVSEDDPDAPLSFWTIQANSNSTDPNIAGIDERLLDSAKSFEELVVMPRDKIYITYVTDADRDGLFRREEALYGTYDDPTKVPSDAPEGVTALDSDGDGLTDFEEVREGWSIDLPTLSPYDTNSQVYPSPRSADFDEDGLDDATEKEKGTDPRIADTDNDGSDDGEDPEPVNPAVTGNFAPVIDAFDITASGLTVTASAAVSDGNLTNVVIDWNGQDTTNITSGYDAINASHTFSDLGQVTVTLTATDEFDLTVTETRTVTLGIPTAGLSGEWLFNDNLSDSSGNGHDASGYLGDFGYSCSHSTADRHGMADAALELNKNYGGSACGLDTVGTVRLPHLGLSTSFTVSMWLKTTQQGVYLFNGDGGMNQNNWLRFYSGSDPIWNTDHYADDAFIVEGSSSIIADGNVAPTTDTWIHYVMRVSTSGGSTTTKLYRDGTEVASSSGGGVSAEPSGHNWYVGSRNQSNDGGGSILKGQVDDIRIYNRALSAGEIEALAKE